MPGKPRPRFTAAAPCAVDGQSDTAWHPAAAPGARAPSRMFVQDQSLVALTKKYKQDLSTLPHLARHGGIDDSWNPERAHHCGGSRHDRLRHTCERSAAAT